VKKSSQTRGSRKYAKSSGGKPLGSSTRKPRGSSTPPKHVKTCYWLDEAFDSVLTEEESIKDICFRAFRTELGPEGWCVVIGFGEYTHGLNLPMATKPTKAQVVEAVRNARQLIEEAREIAARKVVEKKLRPKPGELNRLKEASPVSTD
jgi:hypothetical protein